MSLIVTGEAPRNWHPRRNLAIGALLSLSPPPSNFCHLLVQQSPIQRKLLISLFTFKAFCGILAPLLFTSLLLTLVLLRHPKLSCLLKKTSLAATYACWNRCCPTRTTPRWFSLLLQIPPPSTPFQDAFGTLALIQVINLQTDSSHQVSNIYIYLKYISRSQLDLSHSLLGIDSLST